MGKTVRLLLALFAVLGLVFFVTPAPAADKVDMTGTWEMEVEIAPGMTGAPTFVLKQDGDALSGTYQGAFGEAPVTGKITGNQFVIEFMSGNSKMVYTGTIEGNKVQGKVDLDGQGEGKFTGEKAE